VTVKAVIFWVVMPCSLVQVRRCFGETYSLDHQDWNVNQIRYQWGTDGKIWLCTFAGWLIGLHFGPDDEAEMFLQIVGSLRTTWRRNTESLSIHYVCSLWNNQSTQRWRWCKIQFEYYEVIHAYIRWSNPNRKSMKRKKYFQSIAF
jgi:hypothetical protein